MTETETDDTDTKREEEWHLITLRRQGRGPNYVADIKGGNNLAVDSIEIAGVPVWPQGKMDLECKEFDWDADTQTDRTLKIHSVEGEA